MLLALAVPSAATAQTAPAPSVSATKPPTSAEAADATLAVTITAYRRDILTVREGDTGLARKFNVTLTTAATLRDQRGHKILFENRPIEVHREVFTDSGQLQSEYQTLPLLAESLATKVTHAALDVW